jgi:hypothetical protein
MDTPHPGRELVLLLLARIRPDACLADFVAAPPDHYTLRIDLPDDVGKTLVISRHIVDRATSVPAAHRSLVLLLRGAVLRQSSRRSIGRAHAARAVDRPPVPGLLGQLCDQCGTPLTLQDRLVVRQARLRHARCADPPPSSG